MTLLKDTCLFLVILTAVLVTLHCVRASPQEFDQDVLANIIKPNGNVPPGYKLQPPHDQFTSENPNNCYHFFVARNMSSLLSDATKMLRQVRDQREREWILTFIYRIKSLAEHLRSHPETRNYGCLQVGDEERKKSPTLGELYFEDSPLAQSKRASFESVKEMGEKSDVDNHVSTKSATQTIVHEAQSPPTVATSTEARINKDQKKSIVPPRIELPPIDLNAIPVEEEDDSLVKELPTGYHINLMPPDQKQSAKEGVALTSEGNQMYIRSSDLQQKETLQSILDDMALQVKKLRALGGTEADIRNILKLSQSEDANSMLNDVPKRNHQNADTDESDNQQEPNSASTLHQDSNLQDQSISSNINQPAEEDAEFDDEELGAAAGELEIEDRFLQKERTVAPSLGEVLNSKEQSVDSNILQDYEPFQDGDEDVLVKQLEEERYNPENDLSGTTRALNGQNVVPLSSTDSILVFD